VSAAKQIIGTNPEAFSRWSGSARGKLFPHRFFGYTFFGQCQKGVRGLVPFLGDCLGPVLGWIVFCIEVESCPIIESCSASPYLELFAREKRPGWTVWGHEALKNRDGLMLGLTRGLVRWRNLRVVLFS
jgi:hypothetical protein